ncbi:Bromodomain-containing protein 8 [Choanephora cucurbitarum]|uniref:Bromodomain-containing protein 8 n=1 Tax=Choanephora cucurbitarum TaxID=101091 RepID=A0A1C7NBD6_9FUNG|nr:Bromodomain-containing protein 8 [Choanephora cucurbitarum]
MSPLSNEWTVLEKLLLTQAVYKYGENMWFQVARVLKQHGLIQQQNLQRQPDFYSQKNCSFQYYLLIENMEAEKQVFRNDLKNDMPVVVRLAKQLYIQRVDEIKKSIQKDQDEFNQLATEIDEIKAGKWDMQLIPADVQFSTSHFKRTTEESSRALKRVRVENTQSQEINEVQVISTAILETSKKKASSPTSEVKEYPCSTQDSLVDTKLALSPTDELSLVDTNTLDKDDTQLPVESTSYEHHDVSALPRSDDAYSPSDIMTTPPQSSRKPVGNNEQRQKAWQKNINLLWQEIANHKNGTMFMNPIKKAHAPLYDKVVKQPLYLKTIKNRVRDGIVKTTAEFERDVTLMLTNSLMYNKEGTEMYLMAQEMLEDVREQIRLFKSADSYSTAFWENDV